MQIRTQRHTHTHMSLTVSRPFHLTVLQDCWMRLYSTPSSYSLLFSPPALSSPFFLPLLLLSPSCYLLKSFSCLSYSLIPSFLHLPLSLSPASPCLFSVTDLPLFSFIFPHRSLLLLPPPLSFISLGRSFPILFLPPHFSFIFPPGYLSLSPSHFP